MNSSHVNNGHNSKSKEADSRKIPDVKEAGDHEKNMDCDADVETRCGFGPFYLLFLQPCARVECFTFFCSLSNLITSTLNIYVNSQITTLERQFGFSSSQTGLILAANDLGYLVFVLFASYSATYVHVPRSLGLSTIIFAISGIACSLPIFIFRQQIFAFVATFANPQESDSASSGGGDGINGALCTLNSSLESICDSNSEETDSEAISALPSDVVTASLVIIVLGMALQGCAKSPRNSFIVTYIDNNTKKTSTGLHFGIITAMALLGPVFAFCIGGVFSRMFVTLGETNLDPRHPKWIGAWWLGYLLCGGMAFVIAIPLMFFPRRLPRKISQGAADKESAGEQRKDAQPLMLKPRADEGEKINEKEKTSRLPILHHVRSFLSAVLRLLSNWVYVSMTIATCAELFGFVGASAFMPKYVEQVFDLPSSKANYIMAGRALFGGVIGMLIGGYLTKRFKMTTTQLLIFSLSCSFISMTCEFLGLWFYCEQPTIHNWPGTEESCSGSCGCEENSFFAICGSDDKTYYSPCTAGCVDSTSGMYSNCTCIPGDGVAQSGLCSYGCNYLYPYIITITVRCMLSAAGVVPKMLIFIRCVLPKDKGLAVGIAAFSQSLCGWMAGPVVFGYVVDGICNIWDVDNCNDTVGRCLLYDNNVFRVKIHAFCGSSSAVSVVFILIAFIYAIRTGHLKAMHELHFGGHDNQNGDSFQFSNKGNGEFDGTISNKEKSNSITAM